MNNNKKLKNLVHDKIQEMRDKSLVDFMRASDREMVVSELTKFIESIIKNN